MDVAVVLGLRWSLKRSLPRASLRTSDLRARVDCGCCSAWLVSGDCREIAARSVLPAGVREAVAFGQGVHRAQDADPIRGRLRKNGGGGAQGPPRGNQRPPPPPRAPPA